MDEAVWTRVACSCLLASADAGAGGGDDGEDGVDVAVDDAGAGAGAGRYCDAMRCDAMRAVQCSGHLGAKRAIGFDVHASSHATTTGSRISQVEDGMTARSAIAIGRTVAPPAASLQFCSCTTASFRPAHSLVPHSSPTSVLAIQVELDLACHVTMEQAARD